MPACVRIEGSSSAARPLEPVPGTCMEAPGAQQVKRAHDAGALVAAPSKTPRVCKSPARLGRLQDKMTALQATSREEDAQIKRLVTRVKRLPLRGGTIKAAAAMRAALECGACMKNVREQAELCN